MADFFSDTIGLMKILPKKKKEIKKALFFSIVIIVLLIVLNILLQLRLKQTLRLVNSPLSSLSANKKDEVIQPHDPFCLSRIDDKGWEIKNGQVRTHPKCLTVLNSRFGSRFNMDIYFSRQYMRSGVLGVLEDVDAQFGLRIKENDEVWQVFPQLKDSDYEISQELTLTGQKINFENNDNLVDLQIISPFAMSESMDDVEVKMSSAPFFYLDLEFENKTKKRVEKTIELSFGDAQSIKEENGLEIIYLNDSVSSGAIRALAYEKNQCKGKITKKHGVLECKVNAKADETVSIPLLYAGYINTPVVNDISSENERRLKFAYTKWFKNIEEIIGFGWENRDEFLQKTNDFEKKVFTDNLTPEEKWLMAQSFHSYLANSWLLHDEKGSFEYHVWEGEFKYFDTLDVAHDYGVLEGLFFPWALKSELSSWQKHAKEDGQGTVIPHDIGSRFVISGVSDFKIPNWQTSGMPAEENCNYILLLYWYWRQSNDNKFIKENAPFVKELVDCLINKDSNNNGIVDTNIGITTYDNEGNLALNKGSDNSYLALKQLSAYIFAKEIFKVAGKTNWAAMIDKEAEKITNSLIEADEKYGFIPLSLEEDSQKGQGFTFIVGLFYPVLTGVESQYLDRLVPVLKKNYPHSFEKSLVHDGDKAVGLKLAQKQDIYLGWFSHSLIGDYVGENLFEQDYNIEEIFFPLLFDSPSAFTDGYYFNPPFYPVKTCLTYYPRGVTIFSKLLKD